LVYNDNRLTKKEVEKVRRTNEKYQMIENRNSRREIKLNKRNRRITDEYINQYF